MTAILQPGDFAPNHLFGWASNELADLGDLDALSGLFPDPPSQPPPNSHGPPILSSNEMSQFSSHIEALTSKYKHTANWRDPPRKTNNNTTTTTTPAPAAPTVNTQNHNHNHMQSHNSGNNFSLRRASTTQIPEYGSMDMPYAIDQYHGTLNGLLSAWPNHFGQQHGNPSFNTVAPHQLQNAPLQQHRRRTHSESTVNTADVLETLGINVPEMKNFIGSILSASHPSFSAPFFTDGIPPEDEANLLPPELASTIDSPEITTAHSSSSYPAVQGQPVAFGSDMSFKSPHFTAPSHIPNMEQNFEQRTLQDYGLEPDDSGSASPNSMSLDGQPMLSPASLKRKSFSMADDDMNFGSKRKRLSINIENPFLAGKKMTSLRSPARDALSPHSKAHGQKSPFPEKKRGKKGSPRPRLSESQKKENHKASEAKRRERVVIAQNRLWALLPEGSGKPSQRMRLEQTMDHMKAVKSSNESLRMQLMEMQCA